MKSCKPEWKPDIPTAGRLGVGIPIGSGIPFALHDLLQLSCISCSSLVILVVTYPVFSCSYLFSIVVTLCFFFDAFFPVVALNSMPLP